MDVPIDPELSRLSETSDLPIPYARFLEDIYAALPIVREPDTGSVYQARDWFRHTFPPDKDPQEP